MNPNAKIRNANTGDALSDVRHAASCFASRERGERLENYNFVMVVPRNSQTATP
jgi:hypothetical protein